MTDLLARLNGVSRSGDGWTARCPAHEDRHNSLSIHKRDGRWLIKCHAGCEWEGIIGALETGKASKCAQCGKGGEVFETYIGTPTPVWLHRECADAWLASCDDVSIPAYLDRQPRMTPFLKDETASRSVAKAKSFDEVPNRRGAIIRRGPMGS